MILAMACSIIISSICINGATNIAMEEGGLTAYALIVAPEFKAEILIRSDNFSTPDWSSMNDACGEGVCVAYHKYCSQDNGVIKCYYYYSNPGDIKNTVISVSASSKSGVQKAEKLIGAIAGLDRGGVIIPLEKFSISSSSESPPYCGRREPSSACWPKPSGHKESIQSPQ
jgi:hypothetical protein